MGGLCTRPRNGMERFPFSAGEVELLLKLLSHQRHREKGEKNGHATRNDKGNISCVDVHTNSPILRAWPLAWGVVAPARLRLAANDPQEHRASRKEQRSRSLAADAINRSGLESFMV